MTGHFTRSRNDTMSAVMSMSLAAPARVASVRGLKRASARAVPRASARAALSVSAGETRIQFVKGTDETCVPDVRLTRSKDGSNGTAFFLFTEPDVFEATELNGEITGMYLIDQEGELSTVDVNAKFLNGKPQGIEATYVMKTTAEWNRFMRFMERYAEDNGLAEINERTLVVIDEASMVDLATFHALLKHMKKGARLLLSGDPAQLPPIGFGLIFHELVKDDSVTVRLKKIYRQTADSGIPLVAKALRERRMPVFSQYQGRGEGASFFPASLESIPTVIEQVANDFGGFDGELMVVTATNGGPAGVNRLNRQFHDKYKQQTGLSELKGSLGQYFCPGEPVIHLKNDYQRTVFNGSLGKVLDVDCDAHSLTANLDGNVISFDSGQLIDLSLAYAITCHKCQGSQVKRVIVPVYQTRLLDPSWLYTAITRAEMQVVLVGDVKEIEKALEREFAAECREVGFKWRR